MIRLLFTTVPGDPISETIQKIDASGVSHVGIQVGEDKVLSAEFPKVKEHSLMSFLSGGRRLVAVYEATPEGEKHLMVWRARTHIGDKYSLKELPGFAVSSFFERWLGRKKKNPVHDPKGVVCSEFVLYLDDETGFVTEFMNMDPETTTPGDLLTRLRLGGPTFFCKFDTGA